MRVSLGVLVLAVALSACGVREARQHGAESLPSVPTNTARFSDADPHDWDGRAPATYAVHGIDASRWQGEIDWPTAIANGVSFAFFKATEGGDVIDPGFETYWKGAGQAGLPRGAYHFYYFCRNRSK